MFVIASLNIESDVCLKRMSDFIMNDFAAPAIRIMRAAAPAALDKARKVYAFDGVSGYRMSDGSMIYEGEEKGAYVQILALNAYTLLHVYSRGDAEELLTRMLRVPLECKFIHEHIVSLHSACVALQSKAVCFTGDSLIGKSTRAKAWTDVLDASLISGDRPAIALCKGQNLACGVPWDGKEQVFRNVQKPLAAILEVRRAPYTCLRQLTSEQAYRVLIRQCFVPMWDVDLAAAAMANIRTLCRTTSVFRLFCGPEGKDAHETNRILFHAQQEILEEMPEMKIKENFVLRNIAGEYMVMPTGDNIEKFNGAVVCSEVSAFIFKQLEKPIAYEDVLSQILAEYDVDEATARKDLDALLERFRDMGVLDEEG